MDTFLGNDNVHLGYTSFNQGHVRKKNKDFSVASEGAPSTIGLPECPCVIETEVVDDCRKTTLPSSVDLKYI